MAFALARELAAAGVCIVSGLARGIDAAAHRGALAAGAPTIGVLGGGHGQLYPRDHCGLARDMALGGGAVVSAYAYDDTPFPSRFLARNGLIVSLADVVVIIEAPERSGALNTASWAADANIPVLAVPGDVERPKVAGCLALIRDGAILARNANDVLEALGRSAPARAPNSPAPMLPLFTDAALGLGASELHLLALLTDAPATADELSLRSKLPISAVLAHLSRLISLDEIYENGNGFFARSCAIGTP
jgi:DNA processing protein